MRSSETASGAHRYHDPDGLHTLADRSAVRVAKRVAKLPPKRVTLGIVADETRPPIAIRSIRPYATEEAFLAEERDTLTRTAVTLIGAPSRPRGVVLRFEVTLSDGTPLVRGEGRVLGFQPAERDAPSTLTLRFTRLDAKSKAFVDRAAELREAAVAPPPGAGGSAALTEPPGPPTEEPGPPTEAPGPNTEAGSSRTEAPGAPTEAPGPPTEIPPAPMVMTLAPPTLPGGPSSQSPLSGSPASSSSPVHAAQRAGASQPPALDSTSRNALLDKLRERAKALPPTRVAEILATPRSPS